MIKLLIEQYNTMQIRSAIIKRIFGKMKYSCPTRTGIPPASHSSTTYTSMGAPTDVPCPFLSPLEMPT